jgi:hypothetical protein
MSYALKVIKDHPIMFLPLDETSGTLASDISGCGNDGTHSAGVVPDGLPLIPGGLISNKITNTRYITCSLDKNYYGQDQVVSFATEGFSDNDFSIEIWIYPEFDTAENLIFGDSSNDIGLFWEAGNIIFKLQSEVLEYTLPYYDKSIHVVAVYSVNNMMIYIDGVPVASKPLTSFKFTNTSLSVSIGPTASSGSYFIADAPAVYRYGLSPEKVYNHYLAAQQQVFPIHIVSPEDGYLFTISDENTRELGYMTYPMMKPWDNLLVDGLTIDRVTNSIYLTPTDSADTGEVIIKDVISVPYSDSMTRSKISWVGDNGITVETSIDNETYVECINGEQVPQYTDGIADGNGELYIKITFSSTDTSRFNPELSMLNVSFYLTNTISSVNSSESFDLGAGDGFVVGNKNYPVLSRDYRNGLRLKDSKNFSIILSRDLSSVEFIYTRHNTSAGGLFKYGSVGYGWSGTGAVTKSGISAIYVNGIDKISETDIDSFLLVGTPYHIVIVLTSPILSESEIFINSSISGSSSASSYKNLALYKDNLSSVIVDEHFDLYSGRPSISANDTTITLSEGTPEVHNNDWIVIKSV